MNRVLTFAVLVALMAASCGDADGDGEAAVSLIAGADRVAAASADPRLAGEAVTAFGNDLFSAVRDLPESGGLNVVVSPASVAIALAMLEPGVADDGVQALHELLRIDDREAFHASMNALEQNLEARGPEPAHNEGEDQGELTLRISNAAYLQAGYPFRRAYIDSVTSTYGPVLNEVDFSTDPDAIARRINDFVAAETKGRIGDLVPDGTLNKATVLALVNALYLKASWFDVFDADATEDGIFTLADGEEISAPMMHGFGDSSARGDRWTGATKSYVGGLSAQFILPDEGSFDAVAADLAAVFADYEANRTSGATLVVPRFQSRFRSDLPQPLRALGLGPLFDERGQLIGIAGDDRMVLDQAIHETFVAMDEEGTEAAAATVLTAVAVGGPLEPPVPVVLDRPFLFRILDSETGATLLLGQILRPR